MRSRIAVTFTFAVGLCPMLAGCANLQRSGGPAGNAPPMIGLQAPPVIPTDESLTRQLDEALRPEPVEHRASKPVELLAPLRDTNIREAAYNDDVSLGDPVLLPVPVEVSNSTTIEAAPYVEPLSIGGEPWVEGGAESCPGGVCPTSNRPRDFFTICKSGLARLRPLRHKADRSLRDIGSQNTRFPRELRLAKHPTYVVEPPDVLYIEATPAEEDRPLAGERLIRQDGTISLGYYGDVDVAGHTLTEVEEIIRQRLKQGGLTNPDVYVDIAAFNSKVYYVIGQVEQTGQLPITGKDTVLDALTLAGGVTSYAKLGDVHVARPNPGGGCDQILRVDYHAITECGDTRTNYQLLPGDRVVVPATVGYKLGVVVENIVRPFEPIGAVLNPLGFIAIALRD